MALQLFDTMTRKLQLVVPQENDCIRIYTCGPTVYARTHVGNFRTFIFEDLLRRVLDQRFAKVVHVMNLTDVEDKIVRNAKTNGHSLDEETAPYVTAFFEDLDTLGVRRAHHYPRATEYIQGMVALIQRLEKAGVTYTRDGSVYFRIEAFPAYGRLSGARAEGLVAGASGRVDADEYDKENVRDFALWKAEPKTEPGWDTSLGYGRPGWHIECSAMSMALLGESFDIHCGGVDNIFPHHENEIAQSEAATGKEFVRIWCHSAHLRMTGEKMAKSLGNVRNLRELIDEGRHRPSTIRYFLAATAHYRKTLSFSEEALDASAQAVERLTTFVERLERAPVNAAGNNELAALAAKTRSAIDEIIDDDLNIPEAVGVFFRNLRDANRILDEGVITPGSRDAMLETVNRLDDVLGVLPLVEKEKSNQLDAPTQKLLDERIQARVQKEWARSDELRDALAQRGVVVEDTADGQRWRRQ